MAKRLSSKLAIVAGEYHHWCPGCKNQHRINVNKPNPYSNAQWKFNGDVEKPTFSPSINLVGICHYFIIDGNIQFCADSKHDLAGKTVPLPDFPQKYFAEEDEIDFKDQ